MAMTLADLSGPQAERAGDFRNIRNAYFSTYAKYGLPNYNAALQLQQSNPALYGQFKNDIYRINRGAGEQYSAQKGGGGLFGGGGLGGILGKALPIAASFIPGIGPLGAAAIGGLGGALSGGGVKGALLGAALGGAGSYISGGGSIPGLGSVGKNVPAAGMFGPSQIPASGILGSLGTAGRTLTGGLGKILGGGSSSGGSGLGLGGLGNIVSGGLSYMQAGDAEDKLLAAQQQARKQLAPYNATGLAANQMLNSDLRSGALGGAFNPGDLTQDEGYKFRLAQGQQALERSMAARGLGDSGAALKAAQDYGQGLAAQAYNDAYQQWLQQQQTRYNMLAGQSGQGLNAAGGLADIAGNIGNIQAQGGVARSNILGGTLSSVLGGGGFMNAAGQRVDSGPRVIRDQNGNIIGIM